VFGEGTRNAELMLVGETPGDKEDLAGHVFVGPAGRVLDRALAETGIERRRVYLTNAVKHFKFERQGKRRIHQTPRAKERAACRPWLLAELETVRPRGLVLMGATAAQSLLGPSFKVTAERGRLFESEYAPLTLATVHPSSVLRQRDSAARHAAREEFTADLRVIAGELGGESQPTRAA
jgi:uracil-DNA glycosylase family protein